MNSDIMRWLLDLKSIPKGAQSLRLAWEHPWPGWVWALLIAGAAVFALWSYSRLSGNRVGRRTLGIVRLAMILLLLIIISGPALELPRETVEQDWVLVLADRSESMKIKDAGETIRTQAQRVSRDEQLNDTVARQWPMFDALAKQRHVVWMGFNVGAFNLDQKPEVSGQISDESVAPLTSDLRTPTSSIEFGPPDGRRTRIGAALDQALQRAAARPLSGVVLMSDGRTDDPPNRALVRRLQADAIPVFVVPLGSSEPLGDLAIRRLDAPRRAFVHDKVPVVVELDRLGSTLRGTGANIKLVDQATGETLDQITIAPGDERQQVTLTAEPALAGEVTWKVVIESAEDDLIPENNLKTASIELIDRPLRVLLIDGYPRWEYRYLKNLLVREKSITSSVMLISADRDFAQEGNAPITRLPRSSEEFAEYDVIILGDVPSTFFSREQLEMMRDHVAQRGAGLLWIAGERAMPSSYVGTALADLLPMRGSLNLPVIGTPVTMTPTPLAERLGVLRLEIDSARSASSENLTNPFWPVELSDPSFGWSQLFWAQRIEPGQLKPAAEVLAATTNEIGGAHLPLVIDMRYGSGQSIYVATDEIWRWRFGRGELLPDQFWVQMIRMLGRESLSAAGEPARLETDPRRVATNQPVRIELRVIDSQLIQAARATVSVVLETADGKKIAELELHKVEGADDRYATTYLPDSAGNLRVRVMEPTLGRFNLQAEVEVIAPDDELRRPETDHELLASLASATGGRVLRPDELGELPKLLPNRAVITKNPLIEPIWDTPLALALVLLLLTAEWVGRKLLRLV